MYSESSGQTQILTAVLLGGILIAGISGAYVWGLPILRKNQDVNNAEQSLSDMRELSQALETVASGGGSRQVQMALAGGSLRVNAEREIITYKTLTRGAYVSTRGWVPLNENDMQGVNSSTGFPSEGYGIRGVDRSALLIGKAERTSDRFMTSYRIVARKMFDPDTGQTYRIDLVKNGNLEVSGGSHKIILRSGEEETETGAGIDGGTLHRQKVLVRVS